VCARSAQAAKEFHVAYVITDACIKDYICAAECATAAIAPATADDPAAGGVSQLFINPDECIDCGNCASICPQSAIVAEEDLPAEKAQFAGKNKAYFN
jgi:NAD-dependent dihydropyrimidine dehydrogenase PreA subunit